jgi:hypothetical protein
MTPALIARRSCQARQIIGDAAGASGTTARRSGSLVGSTMIAPWCLSTMAALVSCDPAKNVFQLHGADHPGLVVPRAAEGPA